MKKILIFYASYGGGHLNAAKSIEEQIKKDYPDSPVELVDCVRYVNKAIDKLTTTAYKEAAKLAPWVWGKVYYDSQKGALAHLTTRANSIFAVKLLKLFKKIKPDLIISTHPFATQMCSYLKRKNKIQAEIATIMTDFCPHDQWLVGQEFGDYFFVAHEEMKDYLISKNVEPFKIHVTGIPLSPKFLQKYDNSLILNELQLDTNKKTILFFGGGEFGLGKTKTFDLFTSLITNCRDYQIIAIAGKNEKMKEVFENIATENNCNNFVRVLPFTNKVPELMSASDLVITKPGGLTTTESLASNLPILIINPIPGQEEENAEFLERQGVGIWIKNSNDIGTIANNLLNSPQKLDEMKDNTRKLAKIDSTENICKLLLNRLYI